MTRGIGIATATAMTLFGAMATNAAAQQPDTRDRTIMTFSSAVELPRLRLEAGTYVFRLADSASRNVIQVLSEDEMTTLGQWLFVAAERPEASGDTVVTFRETSAVSTPAVQYWYYPGEKIGKEFIYPRDQALRIAQRTGVTVRSDEGPVTGNSAAATRTGTQAGSQTGTQGSQSETQTGSQTAAQTGSQTGRQTGTQTGSQSGTQTGSQTGAQTERQTGTQAGSQTGAQTGSQTGTQAERQTGAQTGSQTGSAPRAGVVVPAEVAPTRMPERQPTVAVGPVETSEQGSATVAPERVRLESTSAQNEQNELPATAGLGALSAMIGLLSLAGAAGIRWYRASAR